ncbi:MAG: flavin reductase family protein [Gammaproteobacteria bacterium]|nr:flavin reductase family protein [Gammaproteobacteria bacterium]
MTDKLPAHATELQLDSPVWERFFRPAPLVLIGTSDEDGITDLAPKHMAVPLGWDNYFGFVCTPRHQTWRNIEATGRFSVSYPQPDQVLFASLAASPRCDGDDKPVLTILDTFESPASAMPMLSKATVWLDCELDRIVDGFGENGLIAGRITAAYARTDAMRISDLEDETVLSKAPLLTYIDPGRFTVVASAQSFPFPRDMKK